MPQEHKAIVALVPLESYEDQAAVDDAVRQALAPFGGMAAFVRPGEKALLKPNLVAPSRPELAVTTHPAIVRAVIREINACGATADIGDGPGVSTATAACGVGGITKVADEEHARVVDFTDTARFENNENRVAKSLDLTSELKTHDVLITLPKLKTHCQMGMTCAIKNQYGLIPGVAKAQNHFRIQDRNVFADLVIDINRTARPALAIVDAVVGMEGPGPSGGTPRKIGLVVAGTDLAAVDTVCATIIGYDPDSLPLHQAARRCQYGTTNLDDIDIAGPPLASRVIPDYKRIAAPANIMRILPLPVFALKWLRRQFVARPKINPARCIKCGRCMNGCPVKPKPAINPLGAKGPAVNDRTCIRCYCCHEFCPVKAIDLQRSFLDRYLHIMDFVTFCHRIFGKLVARIRR